MFEKILHRVTYVLFAIIVWLAATPAKSDTALIYHSSVYDAHTNVKAQLEADGYTVTMSTSGSIASNLYTHNIDGTSGGYDVVVDLKFNNNIGSNGRGHYDDFVEAGGVLIVTGENETNFSSRNSNIENLISNKFGGSLTMGNAGGYVNSLNSTYTDSSIDNGSNMLYYGGGASLSGDGQWVAKIGSTVVWMVWEGSDLPTGYDGAVYVTGDINQFASANMATNCTTNCTVMNIISDVVEYSVPASTPTYSSAPTSAQLQSRTDSRSITTNGNAIYVTQSGDNLDLDIVQYDNDNLVAGTSTTSSTIANASISGDDNTVSITQGNNAGSFSDNNVTLLDIDGTNNTLTVRQGDNVDDVGGHRSSTNIVGNYNVLGILQENDGGVGSNGHFMEIDVAGNSNIMYMDQKDDGDKMLFLDVNGSSNDVDIIQQGTGDHFLDVTAGSNQTIDILQDGSGSHAATIDMSGYTSTLDLDQSGSTDKTYSLSQVCTNTNGCGTTTVTQN
jgi:hypothetical protein